MIAAELSSSSLANPPPFPPPGPYRRALVAAGVIRLLALGWSEEDAGRWAREAEARVPSPSDSFLPTPGAQ